MAGVARADGQLLPGTQACRLGWPALGQAVYPLWWVRAVPLGADLLGEVLQVGLQHLHRPLGLAGAVEEAGQGFGHFAVLRPRRLHLHGRDTCSRQSLPQLRAGCSRGGPQWAARWCLPACLPAAAAWTPARPPAPAPPWPSCSRPRQRTAWRGRTAHPGHPCPASVPAVPYSSRQGWWAWGVPGS